MKSKTQRRVLRALKEYSENRKALRSKEKFLTQKFELKIKAKYLALMVKEVDERARIHANYLKIIKRRKSRFLVLWINSFNTNKSKQTINKAHETKRF